MDDIEVDDDRRPFRLWVDVLATAEQMPRVQQAMGEALCAAPHEHQGPCRLAWSMSCLDSAQATEDDSTGWTQQDVAVIRADLQPVHVWSKHDVDRSLGL